MEQFMKNNETNSDHKQENHLYSANKDDENYHKDTMMVGNQKNPTI